MDEQYKRLETVERGWEKLFDSLSRRSRTHKSSIADKPENRQLNRYLNVKPYDDSRVVLLGAPNTDYINASFVTVPRAARRYILTQGPLPATVIHFWLMVWEQRSSVIVMLNKISESDAFMNACEPYWPESTGEPLVLDAVDLKISFTSTTTNKHYCLREFLLEEISSNSKRTVLQFHYTAWPDHGSPESPMSFLRLLSAVRKSGGLDKMDKPCVVHCSAGIGRSGTFCLIDSILTMVENQGTAEGIDIESVLIDMRDHRGGLIQSHSQLKFSFTAILYGINVLEKANKLQPHMSSIKDSASSESSEHSTVSRSSVSSQASSKKTRRTSKRKQATSSTAALNVFNQHPLVDALEDIGSDTADELFYKATMFSSDVKKPRSGSYFDDVISAQIEAAAREPSTSSVASSSIPEATETTPTSSTAQLPTVTFSVTGTDHESTILRRREREAMNKRIAEKTQEIKMRMKIEELRRERIARRISFMKKTAIYGGLASAIMGIIAYMFLHDGSSAS